MVIQAERPNTSHKVLKARRDYNSWVATETLEDYALRFAPKSYRKWSELLVANTAIGGISFLALEAIGGSLAINYGFANSFWAILVVSVIIFLTGLPIAYYAAKYNIDMDLLTRGAGFGYIGSTITSLIYASFTFIFFALEAAIMAQALNLYFGLHLAIGYVICSLVIIPLVFFGVTLINQLQLWTQPIWFVLMVIPYICVIYKEPDALSNWFNFAGNSASGADFDPLLFGVAATVSFSLIAQIGEQVDYLRFLPDRKKGNCWRWWLGVIGAGAGWIILGGAKQLGGAFLASLAVSKGVSLESAKEPIRMYLAGFADVFANPEIVLAVGTFFVIVSQIKINVTNAYAGSLAWSNFFSRITHSHPGRVVWLVFNVAIALLLMELGVFHTLEAILGLYSNVAIAWIGALVADLVINKPLGISPSYIEFKRAYLYNINPVGFGAMLIASAVAIASFLGAFGDFPRAYSSFLALGLAFILSPIIAFLTKGKYYIARQNPYFLSNNTYSLVTCSICTQDYEQQDMAYCPIYDSNICSLCCSLDANCHDSCKKTEANKYQPVLDCLEKIIAAKISPQLSKRLLKFGIIFSLVSGAFGALFVLVYYQSISTTIEFSQTDYLRFLLLKLSAATVMIIAIGTWWLVLSEESRFLAQEELDKQNIQLQQEIKERYAAEKALFQLTGELEKRVEKRTAELQNALDNLRSMQLQLIQSEKMSTLGQLVAGVAHEINNPLSFISGNISCAQTYLEDIFNHLELYQEQFPNPGAEIKENAEEIDLDYLKEDLPKLISSMQEGTERIRNISTSLRTFSRADTDSKVKFNLHEGIDSTLLILKHRLKANDKRPAIEIIKEYGNLPPVNCYPGQLNQVFMNIIANAVDALDELNQGRSYEEIESQPNLIMICTEVNPEQTSALVRIKDNGVGMTEEVKAKIFDHLFTTKTVGEGTGLGLSISRQIIVEKHQGKLECNSVLGEGTEFIIAIPL
ncbi:MAG: ATP-binding protein [Oscillatoria sp. PMC 1051.18]|nr:ATP-binding protein [Oscillatoria sp. PMC 1050.18]MEC5028323.1 ATP-binding protein [Oscillatoria sp. PMC 1051.18]